MLPGTPTCRSWFLTSLALLLPAVTTWLSTSEVNVVLVPDPQARTVTLRAVVYSGSADDPTGKEGVAWLTAHVMLQEMAARAGTLADGLRVSVGKDIMAFDGSVAREDLD